MDLCVSIYQLALFSGSLSIALTMFWDKFLFFAFALIMLTGCLLNCLLLLSLNLVSQSLAICNSLFDVGLCCNINVQISPPVLPGSEFRPNSNVFNLLIHCLSNLSKISGLSESGIARIVKVTSVKVWLVDLKCWCTFLSLFLLIALKWFIILCLRFIVDQHSKYVDTVYITANILLLLYYNCHLKTILPQMSWLKLFSCH